MKRNLHAGKQLSGGFSLNIFSDDELQEIHLATLEVMEKTGLYIEGEEALEIFHGGGATVDRKNKIVKFPPYLVEDAIRSAPPKILLAGRSPGSFEGWQPCQEDLEPRPNRKGLPL